MKNPNRFQVALALSRRLDRLDAVSAIEAEKIIASVEAGESINAPLKSFFTAAWERLGRAAAGAGNQREIKVAIGHLQALAEVSDALGFGPVSESVEEPVSEQNEAVNGAVNGAETDEVSVTETDEVSEPNSYSYGG